MSGLENLLSVGKPVRVIREGEDLALVRKAVEKRDGKDGIAYSGGLELKTLEHSAPKRIAQ